MAEVNAKDLTTKTAPASTDSMLLFGTTTNEGAKITVDNLAENILSRLTTKTFPNQVGGSSAATILAQLATLNSNLETKPTMNVWRGSMPVGSATLTLPKIPNVAFMFINTVNDNALYTLTDRRCNLAVANGNNTSLRLTTDGNVDGQTLSRENTSGYLVIVMIYV